MNKTTVLAVAAIIIAATLVTSSLVATDAFAGKKKRHHHSDGVSIGNTEQDCSKSICQSNTQIAVQNRGDGGGPQRIDQSASNSVSIG
jgi:hypothetical protein